MSWAEVEDICRRIALEADRALGPDMVVGIGRGGLIPAGIIACTLRVDLFPCMVTRKRRGEVVSDRPVVVVSVTERVSGQRVLVVDESVMTGETMRIVIAQCKKQGSRVVRSAALWASVESWKPTWYGLESAGYVMFPWDYQVVSRGKLVLNPAYQEYLDSLEMIERWGKPED